MDDVYVSPRKALDALAYCFGRIGRCICSGGRRMDRLAIESSPFRSLKLPERLGKRSYYGRQQRYWDAGRYVK